jgi:hypothetical protein
MITRIAHALSLFVVVLLATATMQTLAAQQPPAGASKLGNWEVRSILVLGNSITLHGPAPDIGWNGNWGMAASEESKDFVHLVAAELQRETGIEPKLRVRNIADFERGYATYDLEKSLTEDIQFDADVIILAIGENVAELVSDEEKRAFEQAIDKLVVQLGRGRQDPRAVVVRSSFWVNPTKDAILQRVAKTRSATFVDISTLGGNPALAARAERHFDHAGVGSHPGDAGMAAIADAILKAIRHEASASR